MSVKAKLQKALCEISREIGEDSRAYRLVEDALDTLHPQADQPYTPGPPEPNQGNWSGRFPELRPDGIRWP